MGLIENAKDAAKLVQQIGNIELYEKLVSLQQDAMSILDENWKLKEEVRHLKEQLRQREGISELASDMEYDQDAGFYIRKSEKAAGKTIPYCPICWKSDKKDIPLNPQSGKGAYRCNIHNSIYAGAATGRLTKFFWWEHSAITVELMRRTLSPFCRFCRYLSAHVPLPSRIREEGDR